MAEEKTVRLKLGPASWRHDGFDPSIEGVPVITHEGADVPVNQEEAVKKAAKANGLTISKEEGS